MRLNEIESICEAILDGEQSETTHLWKMPSLQFLIIEVSTLSCCPEHSAPALCRGEGFLARSIPANGGILKPARRCTPSFRVYQNYYLQRSCDPHWVICLVFVGIGSTRTQTLQTSQMHRCLSTFSGGIMMQAHLYNSLRSYLNITSIRSLLYMVHSQMHVYTAYIAHVIMHVCLQSCLVFW